MTKRLLGASALVLFAIFAGCFSLWIQLDPFAWGGPYLPLASAGSGAAFAIAAWAISGPGSPRGFALVALGLSAASAALAMIVLSMT